MSRREFQFREGSSNKFWAITVDGQEFTVEFGRLGTTGQTQTKTFASEIAARQSRRQTHRREDQEGLQEIGGETPSSPAAAPAPSKGQETGGRAS